MPGEVVDGDKLTRRQKALVDTLVAEGGTITDAAKRAGYKGKEAARTSGSRALALPHVQRYMMQRIADELGLSAAGALNQVRRLSNGAKSEYVKLEASRDLLDRAGFKPIDRKQVQTVGDLRVTIDLG